MRSEWNGSGHGAGGSFPFGVLVIVLMTGCSPTSGQVAGQDVFARYCALCHQPDGVGVPGAFPPLTDSEWAQGDEGRLIRLVLNGMQGPITVHGQEYNNVMTPHAFLTDEQIANVLTYVRSSFGNDAGPVSVEQVARVRETNTQEGLWLVSELEGTVGID
ncbi:MAG: cytochrome c [Rhodothermales bacterium]